MTSIRRERIKREGSPPFTWQVPVIAASGSTAIHVSTEFPRSKKYAPLDKMIFTNSGIVDVMLYINEDDSYFLPAGSITTVDQVGIHHIKVTNLNVISATVLNKIYAVLSRDSMTIDEYARRHG